MIWLRIDIHSHTRPHKICVHRVRHWQMIFIYFFFRVRIDINDPIMYLEFGKSISTFRPCDKSKESWCKSNKVRGVKANRSHRVGESDLSGAAKINLKIWSVSFWTFRTFTWNAHCPPTQYLRTPSTVGHKVHQFAQFSWATPIVSYSRYWWVVYSMAADLSSSAKTSFIWKIQSTVRRKCVPFARTTIHNCRIVRWYVDTLPSSFAPTHTHTHQYWLLAERQTVRSQFKFNRFKSCVRATE